jgi:hypothetical protein
VVDSAADLKALRILPGKTGIVSLLIFSPDRKLLNLLIPSTYIIYNTHIRVFTQYDYHATMIIGRDKVTEKCPKEVGMSKIKKIVSNYFVKDTIYNYPELFRKNHNQYRNLTYDIVWASSPLFDEIFFDSRSLDLKSL